MQGMLAAILAKLEANEAMSDAAAAGPQMAHALRATRAMEEGAVAGAVP